MTGWSMSTVTNNQQNWFHTHFDGFLKGLCVNTHMHTCTHTHTHMKAGSGERQPAVASFPEP